MTVETAADRASLLTDFGVEVTWQVGVATPATLTAIFDSGTVRQEFADTVSALNRRATIICREADLPSGAGGTSDQITVDGNDYTLKALEPDGTGMTVAVLERVES